MAEPMHLGRPTGVDRTQMWRGITAAAIQHVAEAGHAHVTMTAIADGAALSRAAVREHTTCERLAQQRPGDSSGRLKGARNV
jgi:hypothetical protein